MEIRRHRSNMTVHCTAHRIYRQNFHLLFMFSQNVVSDHTRPANELPVCQLRHCLFSTAVHSVGEFLVP